MPDSRSIFILLVWLLGMTLPLRLHAVEFETAPLLINGVEYRVEIAASGQQRQQGLMFREELALRQGMLFVYPYAGNYRIWMKNTLIPLRVIWLDEDARVLGIQLLPPCKQDPCASYGVSEPSKYIIELNAGVTGIKVGDRIDAVLGFSP